MEQPSIYTREITVTGSKSINEFHTFNISIPNSNYTHCIGLSVFEVSADYTATAKKLEYSIEYTNAQGETKQPINGVRQEQFDFDKSIGLSERYMPIKPFEINQAFELRIKSIANSSLTSSNTTQKIKLVLLIANLSNIACHE